MKIAIIGSGISGLATAWYLRKDHDVTIFEQNDYIGGHVDTHTISTANGNLNVDSGFIVFNPTFYPLFTALLNELDVKHQASEMSFGVRDDARGLEYAATSLRTLFSQSSNLIKPSFYRMLWDIVRFYRSANSILSENNAETLEQFLAERRYSETFIEDHLYPMACALWSASPSKVTQFPVQYLIAFMKNHDMLQLFGRPQWRTVVGGSQAYVTRLRSQLGHEINVGKKVTRVRRSQTHVDIVTADDCAQSFDAVVMACHSDQALALLDEPSHAEHETLSAIEYQLNTMYLHTDAAVMPKRQSAWASWNAYVGVTPTERCAVTYHMNRLQRLDSTTHYFVTLNPTVDIASNKIIKKREYHHPVYTPATVAAQQRWSEINGKQRTFYAGAYWGWGFHEDGIRSARRVADSFAAFIARASRAEP